MFSQSFYMNASTRDTLAFIEDIKNTPIYVAFFHGEFDICPMSWANYKTEPAISPTIKVPTNVSLMQLTQPGETLLLSSPILYYLIHKKLFYTNILMPLWGVEDPQQLQTNHPDVFNLYWNLEDRKGYSYNDVMSASRKLEEGSAQAPDALKIMKESTTKKTFEPGDKTHFEKVLRFMEGDDVPNLKLSRYDKSMLGLGLYKYTPSTGKIVKIVLNEIHDPGLMGRIEDTLRLYHLINYVSRVGGGRIMLFSCSTLASPIHKTETALSSRATIETLQKSYISRMPVMSPTKNWDLFVKAFPTVYLPNLLFVNVTTLKALGYNPLSWALMNLLVSVKYYSDMDTPKNLHASWRSMKLQKTGAHGRHIQNIGQHVETNENEPKPGEEYVSYMCRRTKEGCTVMGGKRTRKQKRKRRGTRRF